jgi:HD-like signal output (HDOD) protein
VGCAYGTAWLARRRDFGVEQSQAFFAGLFHDVGKLFVLMVIEQIKRKNKSLKLTDSLLMEAMNRLHAREGSRLLTRWNMPEHLHVIARDHHAACSCWCAWPTWSAASWASGWPRTARCSLPPPPRRTCSA